MTTLLESCRIAPPPGAVAEHSLPPTFFDIIWLHFHPIRRLLFYEIPCSKAYFLETLLPKLKYSLSLTLKHYFPLAGNLVYPMKIETEKLIIRYVPGDSVSLTIFESTNDFENLVGNHPRDADIFYEFIPQANMVDESNHKLLQLLSLQITLFPGRGICIGFANHHSLCDGTSFMAFINCWASINKLGRDLQVQSFPIFERSLVKDPVGVDSILWSQVKEIPLPIPSFPLPTNRVRATYVLSQTELKKLKDPVLARNPDLVHVSSFVVTAAYIWSCLSKSLVVAGEESGKVDDNDEGDFFLFAVDCRARLDPPLPGNYFGNCVSYGLCEVRHGELVGDEGFVLAAKAIALEIQNKVNDKEKILKGVENWITELNSLITTKRLLSVSGSAKVDLYSSADFGWGKAKKLEMLSIDAEKYSMSLSKSRDFEGGLEVGLSLPKLIMDAFAAIFHDGGTKKTHWCQWKQLCTKTQEGGLGVRRLKNVVTSFSYKLWWKFRARDSLWANYMMDKYSNSQHPCNANRANSSAIWKRMCAVREEAEACIFWCIGEGKMSFWHDLWNGEVSLATALGRQGANDITVDYFLQQKRWNRQRLLEVLPLEVVEMIEEIPIIEGNDHMIWKKDESGKFKVKSVWEDIRDKKEAIELYNMIWSPLVRPSISIFIWRLMNKWIPVDSRMKRCGIAMPSRCVCCRHEESFEHLFLNGDKTRKIWMFFANVLQVHLPETSSINIMLCHWFFSLEQQNKYHVRTIVPILIIWYIWEARNNSKHQGQRFIASKIVHKILKYLYYLNAAGTLKSIHWKGNLTAASVLGFKAVICRKQQIIAVS